MGSQPLLQQHADEHNSKKFFDGLKVVYGPSSNAMAPVRSADGTLLTEKSDIVQRWSDHFSQLLNRPSQIDQQALDPPGYASTPGPGISRCPPTLEETQVKPRADLQGGGEAEAEAMAYRKLRTGACVRSWCLMGGQSLQVLRRANIPGWTCGPNG